MKTRFKSFCILLVTLLLSSSTFTQELEVQLSPELKLPNGATFENHLFSDATGHYIYLFKVTPVFGYYEKTMILEKYSPSFEKEYSKEFKMDTKRVNPEGVKYMKGNFAFLLSDKNKREDYMEYTLIPIDFEGKAGEKVSVAKFQYDSRKDLPITYWEMSTDTTQLAFAAISDQGKKEPLELFLSVVDQDFKKHWEGKYQLPLVENQFEYNTMVVANDGSIYILAKVYEDERAKESRWGAGREQVAAYNMNIYHFMKDKDKPEMYQLELGGEYINGASIKLSEKDEIICAGIYSNVKNGPIVGTFLTKLSAKGGSVLVSNKKLLGKEEIELLGDRNVDSRNGEKGLDTDFKFQDVVLKENGSISITAEEKYEKVKFDNSGRNGIGSHTVFYNLDILSMNINEKGELEDVAIIPKKQIMTNPLYSSFVTLQDKDEVYFFYNDDKDNLKRPLTAKPKKITSYRDCVAVVTIQGEDGKLTRKKLFGKDDTDSLFVPDYSRQIGENKLFFAAQRFRLFSQTDFQIGVIKIKK